MQLNNTVFLPVLLYHIVKPKSRVKISVGRLWGLYRPGKQGTVWKRWSKNWGYALVVS